METKGLTSCLKPDMPLNGCHSATFKTVFLIPVPHATVKNHTKTKCELFGYR